MSPRKKKPRRVRAGRGGTTNGEETVSVGRSISPPPPFVQAFRRMAVRVQTADGQGASVPAPVRWVQDALHDLRVVLSGSVVLRARVWASNATEESPRVEPASSRHVLRADGSCQAAGRVSGARAGSDGSGFKSTCLVDYRTRVGNARAICGSRSCRLHPGRVGGLHALRPTGSRH